MMFGLPEEVRSSSNVVFVQQAPTVYKPAKRDFIADGVDLTGPRAPAPDAPSRVGVLVVTPDAPTSSGATELRISANPIEASRVDISHQVGAAAACAATIATAVVVLFGVTGAGAIVSASIGCAAALVCMAAQMANIASFKSDTLLMSPQTDIDAADTILTVTTRRSEKMRASSLAVGAALLGASNALILITAVAAAGPFAPAVLLGVLGFCAMMLPDIFLERNDSWEPYRVQFTR